MWETGVRSQKARRTGCDRGDRRLDGASFPPVRLAAKATSAQPACEMGPLSKRFCVSVEKYRHKIPRSRRYQFTGQGYRLSIVYLKLFEKLYAPLTAGTIHPCPNGNLLPLHRTTALRSSRHSTIGGGRLSFHEYNGNRILVTALFSGSSVPYHAMRLLALGFVLWASIADDGPKGPSARSGSGWAGHGATPRLHRSGTRRKSHKRTPKLLQLSDLPQPRHNVTPRNGLAAAVPS